MGKRYPHFALFAMEEPEILIHFFSFLYENDLSQDAATTFFPECTNTSSNYTTERHLGIY